MLLDRQNGTLFDAVVATSGLAPLIAPEVIRRACVRAGVHAALPTPADLSRALPAIRQALAIYMNPEEVHRHMRAIEKLALHKH
ncbi:hypothetical protein LZC95_11640 [Pendulispora brunnea]|uniref:Uncharacterized protein n=1 Tax=Pendulispora brunnea TaxID=2905690 RepID=A0ABZ2KFL1_9BACT